MTEILIIFIIILFSVIVINYSIIQSMLERNTALYQYKINHFIWSHILFILPIVIFIGFFYLVWAYKIIFVFNLKDLDIIIYAYNQLLFRDSLWFIYFLFLVILIFTTILFILLVMCFFKYYFSNCIKLFIYYCYPCFFKEDLRGNWHLVLSIIVRNLINKLPWLNLGSNDLFSNIIYRISCRLMLLLYGKDFRSQLPRNHWHNILARFLLNKNRIHPLLITLSPLFFILYDCIFNDWVITHVFYYLIVYIPVILLRRFTTFYACNLQFLCEALWRIYYSKRTLLFIISPEVKSLLDNCLASGLERDFDFDLNLDIDERLYYEMLFFPFRGDNIFCNNDNSITVILAGDHQVYEAILDDDFNVSLGKKWILLAYNEGNEKT
jgi:hypothetical protein